MNMLLTLRSCLVLQMILGSEQITCVPLGKLSKRWEGDIGNRLTVAENKIYKWTDLIKAPLNVKNAAFEQISSARLETDRRLIFLTQPPSLCRCRPPPCASPSALAARWFLAASLPPKSISSCSSPRKTWPHSESRPTASVPLYLRLRQRPAPATQKVRTRSTLNKVTHLGYCKQNQLQKR